MYLSRVCIYASLQLCLSVMRLIYSEDLNMHQGRVTQLCCLCKVYIFFHQIQHYLIPTVIQCNIFT